MTGRGGQSAPRAGSGPRIGLRRGRRGDVNSASGLLFESAGSMAAAAFGMGDPERALAALRRMFSAQGNVFSHDSCLVAVEDGRVCGLVSFCRLDELRRRNLATIAPLLRGIGWISSLRLLRHGLLPTALGPRLLVPRSWRRRGETPMVAAADDRDYFISALAVAPGRRRSGLGTMLLAGVDDAARASGAASITVNVLEENAAAIALYGRLGYRVVRRFEPELPISIGTEQAILSLQLDVSGPERASDVAG